MASNSYAEMPQKKIIGILAMLAVLLVLSVPTNALALTVEKTTAQSNETNGNNVIGGEPTRITWEGTVGDDETISSVTLTFPEGTTVSEESTVKATILDGLTRIETDQEVTFDNTGATIVFSEPVPSGLLLRIEIHKVSLPPISGAYTLSGTYETSAGQSIDLAVSPAIEVITLTVNEGIIAWLNEQPWVEAWNSVTFLKLFLNPQLAVAAIPSLFMGWLRALGLVSVGFPLAIPLGLAIAFLRMTRFKPLKFLASLYVNLIRGTPLFLQIYIAFFGLPLLGLKVNNYVYYVMGICVLAMNSSAYLAEIFRAGIQSIHKGQFEAASSLGMNGVQTMFFVIIPQTVRRVIPTMTSEFILLYKDTSLLAAVGVMELMMFAKTLTSTTGNMTPYIVAAGYYLIVTLPLTKLISNFEGKLAAADGSGSQPPAKKERRLGRKKNAHAPAVAPLSTAPVQESIGGITSEQHNSQ